MDSAFIYHPDELNYRFNDAHPFDQKRLILTQDLLRKVNALDDRSIVTPRAATEEEIKLVHNEAYIEAVKALSEPRPLHEWRRQAKTYGLDVGDTPFFTDMHRVTSIVAGGSLTAAELVMSGQRKHALHLGGGLHHAFANKAAGFCVYNDASIAIAHIRRNYDVKVLYIDTDVHHGDGVQMSFYADPSVCTFSIHETGKYLFPGTGFVEERGLDEGFGTCFNVPVEPYTEDESWLRSFEHAIEKIAAHFKPDVIVSQHGCDAHFYDPLSHVHCSMAVYERMPKVIHSLAHQWCDGRWIALGGGGYDIWRVVPRAWSLLWLEMTNHTLIEKLVNDRHLSLPQSWIDAWQEEAQVKLPAEWLDRDQDRSPVPRKSDIEAINERVMQVAVQFLP